MAVMNPCCCRLQLGVTIVAIINIFLSICVFIWKLLAILVLFGLSIVVLHARNEDGSKESPISDAGLAGLGVFFAILAIIVLISALISVVASFFLFIGARQRNMYKCRVWFVVTLFFLGIYILNKFSTIGKGLFGPTPEEEELRINVFGEFIDLILSVLIIGYQLWVVYAFMDELKRERATGVLPTTGGAVHYAPAPNAGDQPPPYGQAGYMPYAPSGVDGKSQQAMYPQLPGESDNVPYKSTTTGY